MAVIQGAFTDSNGNALTSQANGAQQALDVGIDVAGVQVDPRQIRPLTSADVVTAISATAHGVLTDNSGITSATINTATTLMPVNANRKILFIQNLGTMPIWINFTTPATQSQPSIQLAAGSNFTMEGNFVSTEAISVISGKASQPYTAKQA